MAAKNQQSYVMNGSIEAICGLIKNPQFCAELKLRPESEMGGYGNMCYRFKHGVSMSSWGENITITLVAQNPQTTAVTILSECSLPTQIMDWGKNKSNVNAIFAFINRNLMYAAPTYAAPAAASAAPTQAPRFCPNCGTPVQGGAFCATCGTRL